MANVMMLSESKDDSTGYRCWTMNAGGDDVFVGVSCGAYPRVEVCVINASHRAHRRGGRVFANWDAAMAAYKSAAVRAVIAQSKEMAAA